MQDFRRLLVWEKARAAAAEVYRVTGRIPRTSNADLINQMRRAALSIPANIAEGSSRATDRDFARFLQIALASASELECHLQFSADVGLIDDSVFAARQRDLVEIRKMLFGLIRRVGKGGGEFDGQMQTTGESRRKKR